MANEDLEIYIVRLGNDHFDLPIIGAFDDFGKAEDFIKKEGQKFFYANAGVVGKITHCILNNQEEMFDMCYIQKYDTKKQKYIIERDYDRERKNNNNEL